MHYKFTILIILCVTLTNCTKNKFETEKYDNGAIKYKYIIENGKKNGEAYSYSEDGKLNVEISFLNDTLDGRAIGYSDDGNVNKFKYFSRGKCLLEICFYENNKLESIKHYVKFSEGVSLNQLIMFTKDNQIDYKRSEFCSMKESLNKDSIYFSYYYTLNNIDSCYVVFCDYNLNFGLIKSTITDTIYLHKCNSFLYSNKFYAKFKKKSYHSYKKGIVITRSKIYELDGKTISRNTYCQRGIYFSGYPLIQFSALSK